MPPAAQANAWWAELSAMLREATQDIYYQAGNAETEVMSGMTTIVKVRGGLE